MDKGLQELIDKSKKGDKDAYGGIYKIYVKKIYRFIYYMVYERELAEDLTQMVFIKTWVSLHSYDETKGTLQSYLFAIARNLAIDYKRRKREISLENIAEPASNHEADEEILREEQRDLVAELFKYLDYEEKQLIIFRYFEELKFIEIADILKQKEGAIRVKLHRILKKLREKIKGGNYGY
ncbi:RNA polymerase sigma factor [Candidatus Daviesbacteria bacterium]|nr:RNA polymerase sigma factor [Candidatus Daviesbacteria bacterium]